MLSWCFSWDLHNGPFSQSFPCDSALLSRFVFASLFFSFIYPTCLEWQLCSRFSVRFWSYTEQMQSVKRKISPRASKKQGVIVNGTRGRIKGQRKELFFYPHDHCFPAVFMAPFPLCLDLLSTCFSLPHWPHSHSLFDNSFSALNILLKSQPPLPSLLDVVVERFWVISQAVWLSLNSFCWDLLSLLYSQTQQWL